MKFNRVRVPASIVHVVEYPIDSKALSPTGETHVQIKICFATKKYNIGFGIEFIPEEKDLTTIPVSSPGKVGSGKEVQLTHSYPKHKTLIPTVLHNAHLAPVYKQVKVNTKGTLRLIFDNTHSYFTSKDVIYGLRTLDFLEVDLGASPIKNLWDIQDSRQEAYTRTLMHSLSFDPPMLSEGEGQIDFSQLDRPVSGLEDVDTLENGSRVGRKKKPSKDGELTEEMSSSQIPRLLSLLVRHYIKSSQDSEDIDVDGGDVLSIQVDRNARTEEVISLLAEQLGVKGTHWHLNYEGRWLVTGLTMEEQEVEDQAVIDLVEDSEEDEGETQRARRDSDSDLGSGSDRGVS